LILVTNREPYSHDRVDNEICVKKSTGGVVSALDPLMQKSKGVWIAWGSGDEDFTVCNKENKVLVPDDGEYRYFLKRIKLSDEEVQNYYKGYANRVLWPLFHFFIEKMHSKEKYWDTYYNVNKKFAETVLEELEDDDRVWLHDYHLALVPGFIKKEKPDAKIAFFWHIPWTPWEIFNVLPQHDYILNGLLKSDLLGFHTKSYVKNFLGCAERKPDLVVNRENNTVTKDGHTVKVKHFPLGISYDDYAFPEKNDLIGDKAREIKDMYNVDNLILGIDRLDYTKGIMNRIKAFEYLLDTYPEFRGNVTLVQIATPSRDDVSEYQLMKKEIDETIGRINAEYRTENWTPIMYFYRRIPNRLLLTYYKAADIGLLTPIRDGMNLISKEFIAANENNAMLILSEFTGASEELNESVIVNPYDIGETGEAIKNVLDMSDEEKNKRFNLLDEKVKKHDSQWWLNNFLDEWEKLYD
jgi:trehalose 6-phosphate synthase/phosphatase